MAIKHISLKALFVAVALVFAAAVPARADGAAQYVGSAACASCHAGEMSLWKTSHHAASMQAASPATVLGDFADTSFTNGRITSTFHRSGDQFMVRTDGPDGALHDYPIAYTFGVAPLQQYLIAMPGGRYQALGIAWDARPRAQGGQRWYSLYPGQNLQAGDRLHWTGRDQTWNYMCADCHSTDVSKNYDLTTDSYKTSFAEINVACEACHGPASGHLAWAAKPVPTDPLHGFAASLKTPDHGVWEMNAATGIAHRTEARASSNELQSCATCHARASPLVASKTPTMPFLDTHLPAMLEAGTYHADGQIDGEVFEYGSFLQSRMHGQGVTCTDCHEPHAGKLRAQGNALCAQCHMPTKFDVVAHTHHDTGSDGAQCVNCHMPTKTYMGVDARRDHSIRVPQPDLSVALDTPNACTACHTKETPAWAAQAIAAWFPGGRQTQKQFGQAIAAARAGRVGAEAAIDAVIGDSTLSGMARASALLTLPGIGTGASLPAWRAALADPDPLVRLGAVRALPAGASVAMRRDEAGLLADPVRAVRTEAARALAGVDRQLLTPAQRDALAGALKELVAAEEVSSDRPEAHLNLALLDTRQQLADQADAEYRIALRLDPKFVPAMVNLADLDRMRGMDTQGADLLRQAITLDPADAAAHHALGLLLVRQRNYPAALEELRRASELAADNPRFLVTAQVVDL